MGRLSRALALLIALTTLGVGIAGASYVGSDDRIWLNEVAVGSRPGQVVVTAPALTAYRDLHLLVRASAPGGVFLAVGNPVDVSDLAAQVGHYELTGIRRHEVLGGQRRASAADPVRLPKPGSLSVWSDVAEGEGDQELALDLDATPTQLYLQPKADEVPRVQFGARFEGLFLVLLGVAAFGALLLALTIWRMVLARRRAAAGTTHGSSTRSDARETTSGRALAVSLVAVGLVASGCSWIPDEVPVTTPTKVALDATEVDAMMASIDQRLDRARKAANPPSYTSLAWQDVDSGPAYDDDVYNTRLRAALESKPVEQLTHTPLASYSSSFEAYPMWTVAISDTTGGHLRGEKLTKKVEKEQRDRVVLGVFERDSAASPWLRRATASIPEKDVPAPAKAPRAADAEDRAAARRAIAATMEFLRSDGPPSGVEVDELAKDFRTSLMRQPRKSRAYFAEPSLESMPLADAADSLRMVAVEGGQLAIGVRKVRHVLPIRPAHAGITWTEAYGAVNGQTSDRLYTEMNLVIVVLLPDDASTPRVLSTSTLRDIS